MIHQYEDLQVRNPQFRREIFENLLRLLRNQE